MTKRSGSLRRLLLWSSVGLLTPILLYLGAAWWVWSLEPQPKFSLRERYLELLPEIEPDEAAWPIYEDLYARINNYPTDSPLLKDASPTQRNIVRWARRGDKEWAQWSAILQEHTADIEAIRVATRMPYLGVFADDKRRARSLPPLSPEAELGYMSHPSFGTLRGLAGTLACDAWIAAERGEGTRIIDDLESIFRIGWHAQEARTQIGSLVAVAIFTMACMEGARILCEHPNAFADQDLEELQRLFGTEQAKALRFHHDDGHIWADAICDRCFDDRGRFVPRALATQMGSLSPGGRLAGAAWESPGVALFLVGPVLYLGAPGRAEVSALWHNLLNEREDQSKFPVYAQSNAFAQELEARQLEDSWFAAPYDVVGMLGGFARRAFGMQPLRDQYAQLMYTLVAAEKFQRAHKRYPSSLEEMVPRFLDTVPLDLWAPGPTPKPLGYELTPDGVLIWSVGMDGIDTSQVQGVNRFQADDFILPRRDQQ